MVALTPEESSAPTFEEVSACSLDLARMPLDQLGRHLRHHRRRGTHF